MGKGVSDMSEWNYGRWALNLRSLRADLLQVLLWSERSGTATATSSNSWLNSWLLTRPSAMLFGRLPGPSATLPINAYNDDVEANLDMAQKPGLEGRARAFESSSRALKP